MKAVPVADLERQIMIWNSCAEHADQQAEQEGDSEFHRPSKRFWEGVAHTYRICAEALQERIEEANAR